MEGLCGQAKCVGGQKLDTSTCLCKCNDDSLGAYCERMYRNVNHCSSLHKNTVQNNYADPTKQLSNLAIVSMLLFLSLKIQGFFPRVCEAFINFQKSTYHIIYKEINVEAKYYSVKIICNVSFYFAKSYFILQ